MIVSFFLALHNGMESIFKMQIQVQVKWFNLYIVLVITLVKPEETDFSKCKAKKKMECGYIQWDVSLKD